MMTMREATYVADNGREFSFKYNERKEELLVFIGEQLHMTILRVLPRQVETEVNGFMETWNQTNPN